MCNIQVFTHISFNFFSSLEDQIASVEKALKSLENGNSVSIAPDTGKDTNKPTFITYEFIGEYKDFDSALNFYRLNIFVFSNNVLNNHC